tara:strand:+ start:917 stop:2005 length:1089 start_codon:yes stop_codon:yes gene_type:complete
MLTYFNLIYKDDPHQKPIESWGVFKRNASSYLHSLAESPDQESWKYNFVELHGYPGTTHDFNMFRPSKGTIDNYNYSLLINPTNLKICMRDPFHRYCSGLSMINFNLEQPWNRGSTMEPYFHHGGREEIMNLVPEETGEHRIRELYYFRQWVRSVQTTFFQQGTQPVRDYTFGETHLDPTLTIAAIIPYLHDQANLQFIDLQKWTEYTTFRLGISEEEDAVHKWNTPKVENTRHKPARSGMNFFKVLQKEMYHFHKDPRAYQSPQNWQATFEDWLQPETRMYQFFKENPVIEAGSPKLDDLTDLLVDMFEDPYFLHRNYLVRKNWCAEELQEYLPKRLQAAIANCQAQYFNWERIAMSRGLY